MSIECPREEDVVAAVAARRWPAKCDGDLRNHVAACEVCRDLVVVLAAFDAQDMGESVAEMPSAAHMWWRLQMQARRDAMTAAERPMVLAQQAAAAGAVSIGIAALGAAWAFEGSTLAALLRRASAADLVGLEGVALSIAGQQNLLLLAAIAAGVVLTPLALYVALSDRT
jgi:hypothetical protein